jgi:transposase InsO family protein
MRRSSAIVQWVKQAYVDKERVARLMRADGIRGRVRRRFKATTDSKHAEPVAPNVLNRTPAEDETAA